MPDLTGKKWHLKASFAQKDGSRRDRRGRPLPSRFLEGSINLEKEGSINGSSRQRQHDPTVTPGHELSHSNSKANHVACEEFGDFAHPSSTCLLVASLPRSATHSELLHSFGRFGKIAQASVIQDKCYGFVTFKAPEAARDAMQQCEQGQVVLPDVAGKAWYLQASWAASNRPQRQCRRGSNSCSFHGTHAPRTAGICHKSISPPGVWLA